MTEKATLEWIKVNLALLMPVHPVYGEDWLAGMVMRETGILIMKWANRGISVPEIHLRMRGDYGQRKKDTKPIYHGFGYMQIDIDSYPAFVNSGDWQDPHKTFLKAIDVLDEKRDYLTPKVGALQPEALNRAVTAAYNCGQGNVLKALTQMKDVDAFTYNHDYSKEVWRFRDIYKSL